MAARKTLLVLGFASACAAHMFIASPKPIRGSAPKDPLDPSGANFPCHGIQLPSSGGQEMKAGSHQLLAFDLGNGANTAVHGGGSCQISITYETDAVKQKNPQAWRVIYSIEGGCPTDATGNLAFSQDCNSSDEPECVNEFPFTIPKGVQNGHAIMAWTWFNSVGNREMYMNCINVNFSGGDGSELENMPAMFVANLAVVDSCPTTEQFNVRFPQAGQYVTTKTEGNPYPLAVPTGDGCMAGPGSVNAPDSPSTSATHATSTSTMVSSATVTPIPQVASSSAYSETGNFPTATTSSYIDLPTAPSPLPDTIPGSCLGGQVSCSNPGQLVCIGSTHFGLCDIDGCAVSQPVAAGTSCKDSSIVATSEERSLKHTLAGHKRKFVRGHYGHH